MARLRWFAVLAPLPFVAIAACHDVTSEFPIEDIYSLRILDRVLAGPEPVVGANVYLEPTPGLLSDEEQRDAGGIANGYAGVYLSSDVSGRFSVIQGPRFYDLTIRKDLDVGVFRGLEPRAFDIPFLPDGPVTGFSSVLSASTVPAPIEGHSVAYFLANTPNFTDAKSLANGLGDVGQAGSLVATYAQFTSHVTLWAVEYETATGLTKPTSKGSVDLTLTSGIPLSPVVTMTKITGGDVFRDAALTLPRVVSFDLADPPPAGFAFDDVEVWIQFGLRRDARPIGHVKLGAELPFSVVFGADYYARVTATRADGAKVDSGLASFGAYLAVDPTTNATTPASIPIPSSPLLGATFDGSRSFDVTFPPYPNNVGVVEHVLTPQLATGTTVRILTAAAHATLDDVTGLGGPQPAGTYSWSTTYFPTLTSTSAFGGADVRYIFPFATTAPQTIVLK